MQFKVKSISPQDFLLSGVSSPGMNGLTLQPASGRSSASRKFSSSVWEDSPGNPAMNPELTPEAMAERRARVRRSTILLGLVALSFYIGFIVMSVSRAQ